MANAEINDIDLKATPELTDEIELQETAGGTSFKTTFAGIRTLFSTLFVTVQTLTDNALVRANGTAGQVQNSGVTIDDTNRVNGAGLLSNEQTGTAYELVLTDAGKLVDLDNAAAIVLTIPANAAKAFPVGTVINLLQSGAGQVSIAITSDTLNSKGGNVKLTGQFSAATLYKKSATVWILFGDLAA